MANKKTFAVGRESGLKEADTTNLAGGKAYALEPKQALAQYALTGTFNDTFYATAENQLNAVKELLPKVDPVFVAKLAIYARQEGYMKDMPAFLLASLKCNPEATKSFFLYKSAFRKVINNGKMLRTFCQIVRSGTLGYKSFGTSQKNLIRQFLAQDPDALFKQSVGKDPSMADIISMVHPKPASKQHEALFGYLLGKEHKEANLPRLVKEFEAWKQKPTGETPDLPFQMLTGVQIPDETWYWISRTMNWTTLRMNLNTLERHGVFRDKAVVHDVAKRLSDQGAIQKAKAFPFQIMAAYNNMNESMPKPIIEALQDAMEHATANIPTFTHEGVYVCVDASGSMMSPITGERKGASSSVTCRDVAALVASCILRKNRLATVIAFSDDAVGVHLNPRDTVFTNTEKINKVPGGGTNCSTALALLNRENAGGRLVIYLSDNESWADFHGARGTGLAKQWAQFKRNNPKAQLVLVDLSPNQTTQAASKPGEVLNVGGFSDQVFNVIADFVNGDNAGDKLVKRIEAVELC